MQHHTKTLSILFISALLIFSANSSHAQYPGMGAFRAQQNRQFVNQQMQMMMRMTNFRGVEGTVEEYDFEVTLRDNTKKKITSAIYTDTITRKRFIIVEDLKFKKSDTNRYKKIYPSQTLYVDHITPIDENSTDENTPVKHFFGKPTDTCWMFNVKSGGINVYSSVCEVWSNMFTPQTVVGIQLNDGPIVKYNKENLQQIIQQDAEAMKYFDEKKYFKAIDRYNRDAEKAGKK